MPILVILFACHIEKKANKQIRNSFQLYAKKKKLKRRDLIKRDYT